MIIGMGEGIKVLKVDEKWSIAYDTKDNDRPKHWLRYDVVHLGFGVNNAVTAMFYALLEKSQ